MSQLQDNLNEILRQKNAYLLPENLKKDVTLLGVTGTMEAGIDTSDATAVAADILRNKTAYVNGQKVTGTMYLSDSIWANGTNTILGLTDQGSSVAFTNNALDLSSTTAVNSNTEVETKIAISDVLSVANGVRGLGMDPQQSEPARVRVSDYYGVVTMEGIAIDAPTNKIIVNANPEIETCSTFEKVAEAIGLTADKIVTGNTILGITGTGGGTTAHDSVKLFTSSTDMNNDNDKELGDIAIVYNNNTLTGLYVVTSVEDTLTYTPLPTQLSAITSGDVYLNKVVMGANNNIVTGTIPVTASEVDTAEDTTETILGNDTEDFDDIFQEMIEHETNKQGATRTYTDVTNLSGIDNNFASKLTNTVQDERDGMAVSNEYITYLSSKAVALGIAKYTTTKYNTTYYSTELIFLVDPTYNLSSVLDAPSNEGACQVTDTTLHVYRGFGDNCDFAGVDYGNNNYKVIAFNNELTDESERNSRYTNVINSVTAGTYTIDIYQQENQDGSGEGGSEDDPPIID